MDTTDELEVAADVAGRSASSGAVGTVRTWMHFRAADGLVYELVEDREF
jgi:hypothetical protein